MTALPDGAYALALSLLPGVGPASLGGLLGARSGARRRQPREAWAEVAAGRLCRPPARSTGASPRPTWAVAAGRIDVAGAWERAQAGGIGVTWWGRADYPTALRADPDPPAVLFWRGRLDSLDGPCVALIGTRHATPEGRALACDMGRDLAAAGVCVVSGLALGIDGAAHRGALEAGRPGATVGVAASGPDVVYPTRHRRLWEDVVMCGAVISETPPGRPAQTWRFPARNRIIAGLVSLVVVVESHAAGGSLITVDAALARGIEVRAVPGPVRSPASAGTNQLLFDGPGPVRDATDVLIALGAACSATLPRRAAAGPSGTPPQLGPAEPRVVPRPPPRIGPAKPHAGPRPPGPAGGRVGVLLDTMGWSPRSLNWLVARSGGDVTAVAGDLAALLAAGRVSEERGWWQRLS